MDLCPVHRNVKEVISLKINISIKKKDKEKNDFIFLRCERTHVIWNLFPSDVMSFISPLVLFSKPLIKILIVDRMC